MPTRNRVTTDEHPTGGMTADVALDTIAPADPFADSVDGADVSGQDVGVAIDRTASGKATNTTEVLARLKTADFTKLRNGAKKARDAGAKANAAARNEEKAWSDFEALCASFDVDPTLFR